MKHSAKKQRTSRKRKLLIARIKEKFSLNIGTVVFGAIFVYMLISLVIYLTTDRISTYQVTAGPLAKNQTYVGLALRNEDVIMSNTGGHITYYARDNARVRANGIVYGIGNEKSTEESVEITDAVLSSLRIEISSFSSGFDTNEYNDIYRFKYEIEGKLLQEKGIVLPSHSAGSDTITAGDQTIYTASADGLVLYSMDGYEDFSIEQLSRSSFNSKNYHLETLKTEDRIEAGTPVYRIITDESWSVFIPLTDKQVIQLADRNTIRVKFLKDDVAQTAGIVVHIGSDGTYFGELKFNSGVVRYASDRFLELELVTNTTSGLKIPVSSIVKKEFFTIPVSFGTKGGDSDDIGFLIQRKSEDPDADTEFVHFTIYEHKDDLYYLDPNDIQRGDIILQPDSTKRYIVGESDSLEGVYCINKGYAVFRKIVILDQNDEYCIVDTDTPYGLAQFDHIVKDSSTVKEQEILY